MLQLFIDIGLTLIYCALFVLLVAWTWRFWMLYKNKIFLKNMKWVVLEIKLPRQIDKNPMAMELVLRSMIEGSGLGNWYKEKWSGNLPSYSSLEIASLEGVIHFYVRTEKKLRPRIEAAIYSQYPNVEIIEVEDYVDQMPEVSHLDPKKPSFWGAEWVLSSSGEAEVGVKKDGKEISSDRLEKLKYSGDMYPIKTYKDWGLDKDPKESYKHDPLTYAIEQMGSIGPGEYMAYQIIFRDASKWNKIYKIEKEWEEDKKKKQKTEKEKTLSDIAKIEVAKFKTKWSLKKKGDSIGDDEFGDPKKKKDSEELAVYNRNIVEAKPIPMQEREDDAKYSIEAIGKKLSKPQVITLMRTVWFSEKFIDGRIQTIMSFTKPFSEEGYNSFRPEASSLPNPYDYPWQDTMHRLVPWNREDLYEDFKGRDGLYSIAPGGLSSKFKENLNVSFYPYPSKAKSIFTKFVNILFFPFYPSVKLSGFTLNVEELATLYHFPGEVAATPSLPRIDSTKSSSPSNLPI